MKKCFLTLLFFALLAAPVLADDTTFSIPAGGEVWVRGSTHTITYTFSKEMTSYELVLLRNGAVVGSISYFGFYYPAGEKNHQWQVAKINDLEWAPCGSGYAVGVHGGGSPSPYGISQLFTIFCFDKALANIVKIHYVAKPGVCPQCAVLDLTELQMKLNRLGDTVAVRLYWQGKAVADLGQVGNGQKLAVRTQVKVEPAVLTAMKRGEKFELRLFLGATQVHSQAVRLIAVSRLNGSGNG